jgi:putative CocE/NonD family hydrolase
MSFLSRLLGLRWRLPAPLTRDLATERLRIPMRDGLELLADRCYSRRHPAQPAVLIRSCYGRRNIFKFLAVLFAERGVQVVVQSCRGTDGSQGTFRPFLDEQNDGEDTVKWIERQPWFTGDLALWGISYLGYTAWAVANSSVKDKVKAIGLHVTLTNFRDRTYAFGGFTLLGSMDFTATMLGVVRTTGMSLLRARIRARKTTALTPQAMESIPLRKADQILAPEGISWWQDWMDHSEPDDPWWDAANYGRAAETIPPTVMVAGWHDLFLPWQLRDFVTAQLAGRDVRIIIGPWMHASPLGIAESLRQSIALFQERFAIGPNKTGDGISKPRVRLFLMGGNEWREYPSWPIPNSTDRTYFLQPGGVLASAPPASENTSTYDYDPSRPTPSYYGPTTEGRSGSGDMAELERRSDVLIFSSEPLRADLDVIGTTAGEIFLRSSTEYTDVYLCLCDVAPSSRSTNVCDGYTRMRPDVSVAGRAMVDGGRSRKVHIEFWPTAYRFRRGHRIRAIVASGAHPRYARNPGSGEPLGDACTMVVAHQEILHGPEHPSAIILPVQNS